ncbi:hypothetical protein K461DRAFT_275924 [Myriangium duriaei CBS 260.36]|uniref:Uncharacterized protein n=1 Tax=Myriangium duriaei CBS 260.36 TaxID=1168546 RepID=A0A9P4J3H3_9PEZI|nr:hypothetical protein K461DRAFT_275924 [Myriangium duriaei CBS 260.36]
MLPAHILADSPTVVMSAHQTLPDQYFHNAHYQQAPLNTNGLPSPPETLNGNSRTSLPPTPSEGALAGRKRSRGDIYDPEDDHGDGSVVQLQPVPPSVNRGEPVYGPGMTLIYPNDPSGAYSADASTQSGTWLEEKAQQAATAVAARPIMATRKSQRLDLSASRPDDITASLTPIPPRAPGTEPLIDEATRLLGVSWTRMDMSETTQISQRAYTRWISRHYPQLSNVEVWFENSAIPGYLGRATNTTNGLEEYYLWSLDLHQAILVTRNPSDLILKLSQPHMSLSQATEKISADIEPVVEAAAANAAIVHNDRFIEESPAQASGGMDLD